MYWVSMQSVANENETKKTMTTELSDKTLDGSVSEQESLNKSEISREPLSLLGLKNTSNETTTLVSSQQVTPPVLPDTTDQLIHVTLALALVVGLIYGAAWLIKRSKGFAPSTGIPMKTLSVLPMGVKEKIILVEVGGKQILLGMTPSNINTLATFDEPIVDPTLTSENTFSARLKDMLGQNKTVESKE